MRLARLSRLLLPLMFMLVCPLMFATESAPAAPPPSTTPWPLLVQPLSGPFSLFLATFPVAVPAPQPAPVPPASPGLSLSSSAAAQAALAALLANGPYYDPKTGIWALTDAQLKAIVEAAVKAAVDEAVKAVVADLQPKLDAMTLERDQYKASAEALTLQVEQLKDRIAALEAQWWIPWVAGVGGLVVGYVGGLFSFR